MGVYDCYEGAQIKTCVTGKDYNIGDDVPLKDGIYLSYEGAIVIRNGIFFFKIDDIYNKWGDKLSIKDILDNDNPVVKVLSEMCTCPDKMCKVHKWNGPPS